jgi:ubiquinone/menaquinone biosynthesis C-methylase UbiE
MPLSDKVFAGSIPAIYQSHMVPLIFAHYAADLADRAAAGAPATVLETAAGSGVVTRALAPKLAATARYHVTDLNQPMVDIARSAQGPDARLHWQTADALALPFDDATFDCVLCQFGAMFFPDRVKGFAEAKRVLKSGGLFLFNVWDCIEENAFADDVTKALAAIYPDNPPQFMARTPHGYHDTAAIRRDARAAGFTSVRLETVSATSRAPSAHHVATAFCQGTPLRSEIESRGGLSLTAVTDRVADALERRYGTADVSAKMQAHVIVAQ